MKDRLAKIQLQTIGPAPLEIISSECGSLELVGMYANILAFWSADSKNKISYRRGLW